MKNTNTCKRVSFGSKGSMIETLIFDDIPQYNERKQESRRAPNKSVTSTEDASRTEKQNDMHHVNIPATDTTEPHCPSSSQKLIHPHPDRSQVYLPNRVRTWPHKQIQSIDSRDNPFLPGGDLRKEADKILVKAMIIRDTFILKELDENIDTTKQFSQENKSEAKLESPTKEYMVQNGTEVRQCPIENNSPCSMLRTPSPENTQSKLNGQLDKENSVATESVTLETKDDVKYRKQYKKCCTVM